MVGFGPKREERRTASSANNPFGQFTAAIRRCDVGKTICIVLLELLPRALDVGQRADGCGGK
jgi:hypothetical protein